MDIPVYRLIDLARLLFFRALLLEAERRRDVSPSTSAHDTLQTARTHRRRAARRGRGVRPAGAPLSAHGFDSRQRAVDLRPMPDLCGQRARRGRLFAFDANGELIEAPTPAGDAPFAKRTARSSRGAVPCAERPVPSTAEDMDASMWAVPSSDLPVPSAAWDVHAAVRDVLAPAEDMPSLERAARSSRRSVPSAKRAAPSLTEIVSLDLVDSPFPERGVQSPKRSVPSAKRSAPSLEEIVSSDLLDSPFPERSVPSAKRSVPSLAEIVPSDLLDSPFPERGVQSPKRSVPSAAEDVHATVRDRGDSSEARYAALAKRSAQTADRLLRRVNRHRAQGK